MLLLVLAARFGIAVIMSRSTIVRCLVLLIFLIFPPWVLADPHEGHHFAQSAESSADNVMSSLSATGSGALVWIFTVTPIAFVTTLSLVRSETLRRRASRRADALMQELEEKKKMERRVDKLLRRDRMTGLANREHFIHSADAILSGLSSSSPQRKECIVVWLASYIRINQTFGENFGKRFLMQFGRRLQSVGFDACGHLGLGLFVILADAGKFWRIRESIGLRITLDHLDLDPSMFAGVACWPDDGHSMQDLLPKAEVAVTEGNSKGRTWSVYDDSMRPDPSDVKIASDFRNGGANEIFAVFHPQIEAGTGAVVSAEALVRWRHPEYGQVSPSRFVPLLEEAGLIDRLTRRMLDEAVSFAVDLRQRGLFCPVSVNVSGRELTDVGLLGWIDEVLARHDADAELLKLEITETAVISNREACRQVLEELRHRGVHSQIDDFGTGYASLSYLTEFPVSAIKIDQDFVRPMRDNSRSRSIVRSTISMAHELGLEVVAEGVEDRVTRDMLLEYGCDYIQGFLISKPLGKSDFLAFLAQRSQA